MGTGLRSPTPSPTAADTDDAPEGGLLQRLRLRLRLGAPQQNGADAYPKGAGDPVHRLRDLSLGGRLVAALLALLLALPPVIAFFQFLPIWRPTGDNAFIAVRVWDVGTTRTPAMGQPSTSGLYGGEELHVRHLGAWHFYLMAPFVRLLGSATGMLVVSVLVCWATTLTSVWAVFRRLGTRGGVLASAALAVVLFGIGSAALLNPISSNFSRLPMLCAAVLTWAVLSGDVRLLPLATVMVSFAMQQHLSVGPAMLVLGTAALVGMGIVWWRARHPRDEAPPQKPGSGRLDRTRAPPMAAAAATAAVTLGLALQAFRVGPLNDGTVGLAQAVLALLVATSVVGGLVTWWRVRRPGPEVDRDSTRVALLAVAVGAAMWLPLLVQELFSGRGNLSALLTYTGEGGGDTLGLDYAFRQLAHVLGYPPMLINTQLSGHDLLQEPSVTASLTAVAVLATLAAAGYRWLRSGDRRGGIVLMSGVLVLAGLVNGGNVPQGFEQGRLSFYHWIWPLSFFVLLTLAYILADAVQAGARLSRRLTGLALPSTVRSAVLPVRRAGLVVVVVSMVALAAVNPGLDRSTNTLRRMSARHERDLYESLADQVVEHEELLEDRSIMVLSRGETLYDGSTQGFALALRDAGQPILYSRRYWTYVDDSHIAWERDDIDSVLMYAIRRPGNLERTYNGTLLASYELNDDLDEETYLTLLDQLTEGTTDDGTDGGTTSNDVDNGTTNDDDLDNGATGEEEDDNDEAEDVPQGPGFDDFAEDMSRITRWDHDEIAARLKHNPGSLLVEPAMLELFLEHPDALPQLDPALLARLHDNLVDEELDKTETLRVDVYLIVDPAEVDAYFSPNR